MLRETANLRETEMGPDQLGLIRERCDKVRKTLSMVNDPATVRRLSAELNGIYTYCSLTPAGVLKRDLHFLIATDTFQGRMTAELVLEHLLSLGAGAQVFCPSNLSAKDRAVFAQGVIALIKWCDETLPGYRKEGYHVVFNLVGGFKGVQGYLNTLGMFYADDIIYIFENGDLIRIPRLHIRLDDQPIFRQKASLFARLADDVAGLEEAGGVPEVFLETDAEHAWLNEWGQLVWAQKKEELLGGEQLLELPGLTYGERFWRDFTAWKNRREKVKLQETLVKVSRLWCRGGLAALRGDGGIQYETYRDRSGIGHFRVTQGLRVSCEPPQGRTLALRRFGSRDAINQDP
jgi:putative CRISPR-associated protein (TIGR02619 family)